MIPSSPLTPRDITEKLSNAESRREERLKLKKENIDEKLATVQNKKEELINEKSNKVKEVKSRNIVISAMSKINQIIIARIWRTS